jgi:cAMP-binding proteins - catabolite gene activator and regulatory subunit of cAMP-dependent protein kinases
MSDPFPDYDIGRALLAIRTPLLLDVDEDVVANLLRGGTMRSYAPGAELFAQGASPTCLHIVMDGAIKVWRSNAAGVPIIIDILTAGSLVGCAAVFRDFPYPATATAFEQATTFTVPATRVHDSIRTCPALAANALAVMSGQMDVMVRRLQDVSVERADRRIARTLLRLADRTGDGAPVALRFTRQSIAELSATTLPPSADCSRPGHAPAF